MNDNLLQAAKSKYDHEGYAVFPNVLDSEIIHEARQHVEWLMKQNPGRRPELLGHDLVGNDPFWVRLISDERLLDIAETFIGPNIALYGTHYICKPPLDGQKVLWHQDGSYWPLEPMNIVTLWLAVDDSVPENGCLRVIPGSHTMELHEMVPNTEEANVLGSELNPALVDKSKAVDVTLSAGSVSVHHPNVIHGSEANASSLRRCGLTIRYIPTTTKILTPNWTCFLLRGNAVEGVNEYSPKPRYVEGVHMPFRGCESWR